MEKVVIFGTGSVARDAYYDMSYDGTYDVVAFTRDRRYMTADREELLGLSVVPFEDMVALYPPDEYKMLIAIGAINLTKIRATKYEQAKEMGYQLVNSVSALSLIHI